MKRKHFLKTLAILPVAGAAMKLSSLNKMAESFRDTEQMPVLFMGHGSPMNAIDENEFVRGFRKMGEAFRHPMQLFVCQRIGKPRALLSPRWRNRPPSTTLADFRRPCLM